MTSKKVEQFLRNYKKNPIKFSKRDRRSCLVRLDLLQDYIAADVHYIFFCPLVVSQAMEQFINKYKDQEFSYIPFYDIDDERMISIGSFSVVSETRREIRKAYEICKKLVGNGSGDLVRTDDIFFEQVVRTALREQGTKTKKEEDEFLASYNKNIDWERAIPFFQLLKLL